MGRLQNLGAEGRQSEGRRAVAEAAATAVSAVAPRAASGGRAGRRGSGSSGDVDRRLDEGAPAASPTPPARARRRQHRVCSRDGTAALVSWVNLARRRLDGVSAAGCNSSAMCRAACLTRYAACWHCLLHR